MAENSYLCIVCKQILHRAQPDMTRIAQQILDHYYPLATPLRKILLAHSRSVARKAVHVAAMHPELHLDKAFLEDAAMLHDIGICRCQAPGIECRGTEPYICHGIIGARMVREWDGDILPEYRERLARVCERHTGTGLTRQAIISQSLPLPACDLMPATLEEQVVCYADKFFSKTRLDREKTFAEAERSLMKFGPEGVERFRAWARMFG